MIPEFNQRGYLPAGVHPATVAEIEARFGSLSELRRGGDPMNLASERELVNTRAKLARLERTYRDTSEDVSEDARVREITMRSLARLINQLKEEIAVYVAHR